MMFLDSIISNFNHFSLGDLISTLSSPTNWGIILSLVVIEGLLSADNALVLAMMVKPLPDREQKRALFYGVIGAYIFRFVAIGFGTILIKLWWIKLLGAIYLLFLSVKYFVSKNNKRKNDTVTKKVSFWGIVFAAELMDIAFSFDSILAALGVSDVLWVLFIGAAIGILMMRGVANIFIKAIGKCPELETTAYILILFISIKMALTLIDIEISEEVFMAVMVLLFGGTFLLKKIERKK